MFFFDANGDEIGRGKIEVESYLGIFARLGIPANPRFYPYVMLGYGSAKLKVSGGGDVAVDSDKDIAYGIGANIGFTDKLFGKIEHMNYYDDSGDELSGFAIGLEFNF